MLVVDKTTKNLPKIPRLLHITTVSSGRATSLVCLRVNVSKDQSRCFQGSVNLADLHIYCSVFHADSRGAIRFS